MYRSLVLTTAAGVVGLGLAVRHLVPGPFGEFAGVVLYAVLIHCLITFVRPRAPLPGRATATVILCWAVELLQLTPVPAAVSARSTLGRLVLGVSFQWSDLACYAAGAILAAALERSSPVACEMARVPGADRAGWGPS